MVAEPPRSEDRQRLASLVLQQGASDAALAILTAASGGSDIENQRESLALRAIARSLSKGSTVTKTKEAMRLAQKAIKLAPMNKNNWKALAFVSCHEAS